MRDLGINQRQDDIDIVDHQVGDHVHVGRAGHERAHAVRLDEARVLDPPGQCHHPGIETLEMTDLQHHTGALGGRDNRDALLDGRCNRLFQQHVNPVFEEQPRHREMRCRRDDNAHCIDLAQ